MQKPAPLFMLIVSLFLASCNEDFAKIDVTYNRATGLYADLEALRQTPLIGSSQEIIDPGKIFVSETLLLVGEEQVGVHVLNNSDPENPVPMLFINIPGNREFFVQDDKLYAESYYDMLKIDISDVTRPVLESRVLNAFGDELKDPQGNSLIGFEFEVVTESFDGDDDFYQSIQSNETNYFDYADRLIPASAVPSSFAGSEGQANGTVNRIATYGDYVYVLGSNTLTSFRDGSGLEVIGTHGIGWQMETIFPHENQLFIGTQNSVEIFDLSNPEQPQYVSSFWHATSCDPVYPVRDVAYVTLRTGDFSNCRGDVNALVVLDIDQVREPEEIQEIEMESPYGMSMIGTDLYVGEGANGLKVFDATDRRNLVLKTWDQTVQAYDVIPHPTRIDIILIAGPDGLSQFNIQTPGAITLLSTVSF